MPLLSLGSETIELEIIDFGVYENKFSGNQVQSDGVAAGHAKPSYSMHLIKETNKIKGKVGVTFGFRFKPTTSSQLKDTLVKFCGSHPPMKNDSTGVQLQNECFNYLIKPNKVQWHAFSIEKEWEIVRGNWSLYIEHNDKVLAKKQFLIE